MENKVHADQLDKLQKIGAELNQISRLDDLCWALAEWVEEVTGLDDCLIYVKEGTILTQMASIGAKQEAGKKVFRRIGLPLGTGIVGAAALLEEPIYIPDVSKDDRYIHDEYPGASEYATPMMHRGEVLGVIDCEHDQIDGISEPQRHLLRTLSMLAAPHLATLMQRSEATRLDLSEVIADLAHLPMTIGGNLRNIYANITERASYTLRAPRANIWLMNEAEDTLVCIDHFELATKTHSDGARLPRPKYPAYFEALNESRIVIVNNAHTDPRTVEFTPDYLPAYDVHSMLDAPIREDGKIVGVVCVEQTGAPRTWTNDEASFVATLSDLATIALISDRKYTAENALIYAQKNESLGRLAGGIAHDFNNLLTVISGAIETLQLRVEMDDDSLRLANLILDASGRASRLTRNLIAFGGNQAMEMNAVSARALCTSIQTLVTDVIREDIDLNFELVTPDMTVMADLSQLEQVLLNLILNAVDALPDGGKISVIFEQNDQGAFGMTVQDNGTGMAPEIRERIFDPFFTTKGERGSGLGLSVCQGIIRQHRGSLTCTSTPGNGSQFVVTLPVHDSDNVSTAPTDALTPVHTGSGKSRILLIEDEGGVRDVVTQMLRSLGHEPVLADNAHDALEKLKTETFDLLLSDVVMPDLRGPELYRLAREVHPHLPALFISGYTDDILAEIPMHQENVGYLAKPFTLKELESTLNRILAPSARDQRSAG